MVIKMNKASALKKAIDIAGGQSALAEKLTVLARDSGLIPKDKNINQKNVTSWVNRQKQSPSKFVYLIAAAIDNKVTAKQLRPDLYPNDTSA
jgi:DNA-binding transcriptional regulator YdaS (Cro superfamily)